MTCAAVAADLCETLDVKCYATTKVTFYHVVLIYAVTEKCFLLVCQVLNSRVGINTGSRNNIVCGLGTYTVDVSETDLDSLVSGQVDT